MPQPRFQFSIRWIFAVTAIVGVALAILSVEPNSISSVLIQLIFLAMPGLMAVLLVSGRGYARSFAMGAAVPTLIGAAVAGRLMVAGNFWITPGTWKVSELAWHMFGQRAEVFRFFAIYIWSATLLGGIVAVVIRWLVGTTPE